MRAFQHSKAADCGFNLCGVKNSLFEQLIRHKPDGGAQGVWGRCPHKKEAWRHRLIKKVWGNPPQKKEVFKKEIGDFLQKKISGTLFPIKRVLGTMNHIKKVCVAAHRKNFS